MNAAGVEVHSVPTAEELIALAEKRAAEPERTSARVSPERKRRDSRASAPPLTRFAGKRLGAVPLATAAALGAVGVLALVNRDAIVAHLRSEPIGPDIGPDKGWTPPRAAPTPSERAAPLRQEAFAACQVEQWEACASRLDDAKAIDPEGETAPRIVAVRKQIADSMRAKAQPK